MVASSDSWRSRGSGDDAVAIVQVETTLYEVRVGDMFAGSRSSEEHLRVVRQRPVRRRRVHLCEGDRTLK